MKIYDAPGATGFVSGLLGATGSASAWCVVTFWLWNRNFVLRSTGEASGTQYWRSQWHPMQAKPVAPDTGEASGTRW